MRPHDLHLVFSDGAERLKAFDADGKEILDCEARNRTVAAGYGHDGKCPRGSYFLASPELKNTVPFGKWFIPLLSVPGRAGIGIHGGGSGLADPFAPHQGWQITEGCIRVENEDLAQIAGEVAAAHLAGGRCLLTVEA